MREFGYHAPRRLDEAIALLKRYTVKTFDTRPVAEALKPALGPQTPVGVTRQTVAATEPYRSMIQEALDVAGAAGSARAAPFPGSGQTYPPVGVGLGGRSGTWRRR